MAFLLRVVFAALLTMASTLPAFASQDSYPMSFEDCLRALSDTAKQVQAPLIYRVNTPNQKDFVIATDQGPVTMSCQRVNNGPYDAVLTVSAPGSASVAPYVTEGYQRAK
jgi:hypothetical protein